VLKSIRLSRFVLVTAAVTTALATGHSLVNANGGQVVTSAGVYRIPYENGTAVTANNDHITHPNVPNRVDLGGPDNAVIVAAASGIIRGLVDRHGNSNGLGDGLSADGSSAQDYSGVDDTVDEITLTASDIGGDVTAATALTDDDVATVTVLNVPPTVTASGDSIDEAGTAVVSATFTDPSLLDTHTGSIAWGDGTHSLNLSPAALAAGVAHVYGDNGSYTVTVTVTDDDGGAGNDIVSVVVANVDPGVNLDLSGAVTFPGGDYLVVQAGSALPSAAEGTDVGSDDLTFTWSVGDANTYFQ
jgi:hypothetical protein